MRFISVNDGIDTIRPEDTDSLETSFKALLYDLYSRDLSRKVRSAKQFCARQGDFLSPFAPFGYCKDPTNPKRLVIDPPAAEIVRQMFQMAADGLDTTQIARNLNRGAVPTAMRYKRAAGCSRTPWLSVLEENFWTNSLVAKVLRDERYLGKNIYGKRTRKQVGCPLMTKVDRASWIVKEGTHEGIVTQEEFDRAQAVMRAYQERSTMKKHDRLLRGKVRCGVCGYAMARTDGKAARYFCRTPNLTDAYACPEEQVPESDILERLKEGLRVQILLAANLRRLWEERHRVQRKDASAVRKSLSGLRESRRQQELEIRRMYEAFALGELDKAKYLAAKAAAVKAQDAVDTQIAELEAELENTAAGGGLKNGFVSCFQKFEEIQELTADCLEDVLQSVLIYPGGRIEIVWNYRDELNKLMLSLQGDDAVGGKTGVALLQNRLS